jgi:SAM-dependent methyltransferase
MPDFTKINKCRLCNSKKILSAFKLASIPVPEIYQKSKKLSNKLRRFPMTILRCSNCFHVQIKETINKKFLWKKYTYFSGQTKAIDDHFRKLAKNFIKQFKLSKNDLVLDIGSNDGSFLKFFKSTTKILGIDPSRTVANYANHKNKVKTLITFFDSKCVLKVIKQFKKPRIILAFNVFAHTPSMNNFVKNVEKLLDTNGIFIFEAQYLSDILKNKILGTFFHEHISHHSIYSLIKLFKSHNLKLINVMPANIQKGSIIGFVTHDNSDFKISSSVKKYLNYEKKEKTNSNNSLKKFKSFVEKSKNECTNIIKKYNEISAYGAARSGPTLLRNMGLENKVKYIFDDHPMKINRYTPSSGIKIIKTDNLKNTNTDLCIITAYLHSKKIIKKNIALIKKGLNFMILYPKPRIINSKNYKIILNEKN